jgi:hypothetical protein
MTVARHIVALLRSHIDRDEERFLSVATQLAAHEARQGHGKLAQELRELVDAAKDKGINVGRRGAGPVPLAQPKGELSNLLAARYSDIRLNSMVLGPELRARLARVSSLSAMRSACFPSVAGGKKSLRFSVGTARPGMR